MTEFFLPLEDARANNPSPTPCSPAGRVTVAGAAVSEQCSRSSTSYAFTMGGAADPDQHTPPQPRESGPLSAHGFTEWRIDPPRRRVCNPNRVRRTPRPRGTRRPAARRRASTTTRDDGAAGDSDDPGRARLDHNGARS
jgi:hypothetical protein